MIKLNKKYIIYNILNHFPEIGIALSVLFIIILVYLKQWTLLSYGLFILIPVMITCALFWKYQSQICIFDNLNYSKIISKIPSNFFWKLYLILFILLVIYTLITNSRDSVFLILITVLYVLSFIQIISKFEKYTVMHVLVQLMLTTFILIITKSFCYDFPVGSGDFGVHAGIVETILSSGNTMMMGSISNYNGFTALFHIDGAVISFMTKFTSNYSIGLLACISFVVGGIFIYYIANRFTSSKKIALLSVMCYFLIPANLRFGYDATSKTLCFLFSILLLYLFFTKCNEKIWKISILTIIVCIALGLLHHGNTILYVVLFDAIAIYFVFIHKSLVRNQKIMLLIINATLIAIISINYIGIVVIYARDYFFGSSILVTKSISDSSLSITNSSISLYYLSYTFASIFIIVFALFAMFYLIQMISKRGTWKISSILLPVSFLFIIFIEGIFYVVPILNIDYIIRLETLISPLFSIVLGIGCATFISIMSTIFKNKFITKILCVTIIVGFIISSPILYTCRDSGVFEGTDLYDLCYNTDSDLNLVDFESKYITSDTIYGDLGIFRVMYYYRLNSYRLGINEFQYPTDNLIGSYVAFRNWSYIRNTLQITVKSYSDKYLQHGFLRHNAIADNMLYRYNTLNLKIYDSELSWICYNR